MTLLSRPEGLALLIVYGLACYALTRLGSLGRTTATKTGYLVADRHIGWVPASLSIAATWIWAPALFVAAQQAYQHGWVGVFWFTVPNVGCLIVFAFVADRVRRDYPDGFTLSGLMRDRYGPRVQRLYLVTLGGLAVCSFAVQLLAGGLVVAALTGLPFAFVTITLAGMCLAYSWRSGIGASIVTDYLQMGLIAGVGLVLAPWVVMRAGLGTTLAGLGGLSGDYDRLTSGPGLAVFWGFGLSTTIGLLSGPFGDQSFWQRVWALREGHVKRSFLVGAGIFALVPLTMSLLGFTAAGARLSIDNLQLTNLAAVLEWLPGWTVIPFLAFLLSGLTSTLDSNLAAVSSMAGHDLTTAPEHVVRNAKRGMIALAVGGTLLANLPALTVVGLFIFYGTLRSATLLPTVLTLLGRRSPTEAGMVMGITAALAVGLPLSAFGNLTGTSWAIAGGSLAVLTISGALAAFYRPASAPAARPAVE